MNHNKEGFLTKDPPSMLIMHRKSIKNIGGDQFVATYYINELNRYISIPYGKGIDSSLYYVRENFINYLALISNSKENYTIKFNDNSELNINNECATNILNLVTEENKEPLIDYILESDKNFLEILEYSISNKE